MNNTHLKAQIETLEMVCDRLENNIDSFRVELGLLKAICAERAPITPPRYDDVYYEGMATLAAEETVPPPDTVRSVEEIVEPDKCKHEHTKWGPWCEVGEGPITYTCLDCGIDLLHEYLKQRRYSRDS